MITFHGHDGLRMKEGYGLGVKEIPSSRMHETKVGKERAFDIRRAGGEGEEGSEHQGKEDGHV